MCRQNSLVRIIVHDKPQDVLGQIVVIKSIELIHIQERYVPEMLHPVEQQHQCLRTGRCDCIEHDDTILELLNQIILHPWDILFLKFNFQTCRVLQKCLKLGNEIVGENVILNQFSSTLETDKCISVLGRSEIQHTGDEVHHECYWRIRFLTVLLQS